MDESHDSNDACRSYEMIKGINDRDALNRNLEVASEITGKKSRGEYKRKKTRGIFFSPD